MERPRQTRLLIRRSGTHPKPKADTSLLPASGCNTRKYGGLWIIRYETNLRSTDGRTSLVYGGQRSILVHRPSSAAALLPPAGQLRGTSFILSAQPLSILTLSISLPRARCRSLALALSLALLFLSLSGLAEKKEKEKKKLLAERPIFSRDTTNSRDEAALFW
ncbi:hypothetical protein GGI43DRAFT_207986 [Trichoderma evansii]